MVMKDVLYYDDSYRMTMNGVVGDMMNGVMEDVVADAMNPGGDGVINYVISDVMNCAMSLVCMV